MKYPDGRGQESQAQGPLAAIGLTEAVNDRTARHLGLEAGRALVRVGGGVLGVLHAGYRVTNQSASFGPCCDYGPNTRRSAPHRAQIMRENTQRRLACACGSVGHQPPEESPEPYLS